MSNQLTKATLAPAVERMKELGLNQDDIVRESGHALSIVNGSKRLKSCSAESIVKSVIAAASTGLTLNPSAKFACLVPRWSPSGTVCDFEPMWRGMAYLAVKEGAATKFNVQAVKMNDFFEGNPDNDQQPVTHKITSFDRGETRGYYCSATMLDGTKVAEFMSIEDIEIIRDRSDGYKAYVAKRIKSNPWASDFSEMAKKTVLKRSIKRLPIGKSESPLYTAIDLDNKDYTVETVEVPVKVIEKPELTPDHESWGKAVEYVSAGTTRTQIEKKYRISDANWKTLGDEALTYSLTKDLAQTV